MDKLDKIIDTSTKVKDLLKDYEDLVQDTSVITFEEFEKCMALAKDMVHATKNVYDLADMGKKIPEDLYANVIRLHNSAIDFIIAMKEFKNRRYKKWLTQENRNRNGRMSRT